MNANNQAKKGKERELGKGTAGCEQIKVYIDIEDQKRDSSKKKNRKGSASVSIGRLHYQHGEESQKKKGLNRGEGKGQT